jgi:hypothetical protein
MELGANSGTRLVVDRTTLVALMFARGLSGLVHFGNGKQYATRGTPITRFHSTYSIMIHAENVMISGKTTQNPTVPVGW